MNAFRNGVSRKIQKYDTTLSMSNGNMLSFVKQVGAACIKTAHQKISRESACFAMLLFLLKIKNWHRLCFIPSAS